MARRGSCLGLRTRNEPDMPRCISSTSPEVEIGHEIFCTTAEPGHDLPLQPGHKILLERKAQILASGLRDDDFRTLHDGLKAAADGLDFGQFRHGQAFTL